MNESKFTPGPWTFDGGEMVKCSFECAIADVVKPGAKKDLKGCVAYPYTALPDVCGNHENQRIANGHLIAVAPEMFELLQKLQPLFKDGRFDYEIEAIFKKARGEK